MTSPPFHVLPENRASRVESRVVPVDLTQSKNSPSYDIVIGDNILADAGALIASRLGKRTCVVITDTNVGSLYQKRLEATLGAAGHIMLPGITVPAGEASKDFVTLQSILERILSCAIDRRTLIIALGGGVIGDLAGLAASMLLRGLDIVQIPTTLLAQVDSSVGGKTGVNTDAGKNTVGTFYQPRLVVADVALLDSLPRREMLAGYAEVVKYGLIGDASFYVWCKAHGGKLLNGDHDAQINAVAVSCAAKARIVAADEREAGERALLNLGHTFGHALEAATGYDSGILLHGEAVAIGIVMAFKLSAQLSYCPHAEAYDVRDHFVSVGLPVMPPPFAYDVDELMALMARDKKATGGKIKLILARVIGKAFITDDVRETDVRDMWVSFLKARPSK